MRLNTLDASLAQAFQSAPTTRQQSAVKVACSLALQAASVEQPVVAECFDRLCSAETISAAQLSELRNLAQSLDEQYFDLQEHAGQDEASHAKSLQLFSQARAVSALLLACGDGWLEAAADAIYEASAALEDQKGFLNVVLAALSES